MVRTEPTEDLLRTLAPQVLGALVRRYGHFDQAEDAVQDALLAAARQWPDAHPDDPRAWLIRVASRRLIDQLRSETARRQREDRAANLAAVDPVESDADPAGQDDSLTVLLMACHPVLGASSQIALTLRAVGGLTTREIATALLTPEPTIGQRISRAKQTLRESREPFELPAPEELGQRVDTVLHVLYLIFNEGYAATAGQTHQRTDLATEAIRLARMAHRLLPDHREVAGLLSLLLLTHARHAARTDDEGLPVPLREQDRTLWDRTTIGEGVALLDELMAEGPVGAYQLQAAIAALHDEAASAEATDWRQILGLYELLDSLTDNPIVALNRTVAVAMVHGPRPALRLLETLSGDPRLAVTPRTEVVRGHLLERAGQFASAREALLRAAAAQSNLAERTYLLRRASELEIAATRAILRG